MDEIMNIAVVINDKYVSNLIVMLTSLFMTNKGSYFKIFIFHAGLLEEHGAAIDKVIDKFGQMSEYIYSNGKIFEKAPILSDNMDVSAYFKLLIPRLLPESVERVLYLDADIIIRKSIYKLYHTDLKGKELGAAKDYFMDKDRKYKLSLMSAADTYINTGVLIFDLDKLRRRYDLDAICNYIEENGYKFRFHDQEVFNALYHKNVYIIKNKYNCLTIIKNRFDLLICWLTDADKVVVHFAGSNGKPWNSDYYGKYFGLFWKYALAAGYQEEYSKVCAERRKQVSEIRKKRLSYVFPELVKLR